MKKYLCCLVVVLLTAAHAVAAQPTSSSLGTFERWTAMMATDSNKKVCFITSEPVKSTGKYKKRDKVIAFVTHRPTDKQFDVVSHVAGYTFKDDTPVIVTIGKNNFSFFTKVDTAWATDEATDKAVVKAMINGKEMAVRGVSKRGTRTTDTYSLKGFSAAYDAMNKACK